MAKFVIGPDVALRLAAEGTAVGARSARARGRADMPLIGVFAARGPYRPNPIGVSACRILAVGDTWLSVRGLDAVDGTPVLDIKPVMPILVPADVTEPDWSRRLMAGYYSGEGA